MSEECQKHGINPNSPRQSPLLKAEATKMDSDLHALFVRFKLDSVSTMVADALGVEVISDFFDLEAKQILQTSRDLSLKPVVETRLVRMYQFVIAGLDNKVPNDALSPEQSLTPRQQLSPQSTEILSSGTLSPPKVYFLLTPQSFRCRAKCVSDMNCLSPRLMEPRMRVKQATT
jgi:hypothetical protein